MIHGNLRRALVVTMMLAATACRRDAALSTEEIVGEWQKPQRTLPPVNLLLTSEGTELRARLRLSGAESKGRAKVEGRHLTVDFDDARRDIQGDFVTKTELLLRMPNGGAYTLRKRP